MAIRTLQLPDGRKIQGEESILLKYAQDNYGTQEEEKRGVNLGGYVRNVAQALPVIGTYTDEIEASIRSNSGDKSYEEYLKNARESFEGNLKNAPYAKAVNIGSGIAGNAVLAALTGGATLLPSVSSAQGAIEGFGAGEGTGNRIARAGIGAGVGYAVPAIMNKILPTKNVAEKTITKYAEKPLLNKGNTITTTLAKALKSGDEPVSVIAKESTRGTRPAIFKGLQQSLKGNDKQAQMLYDSALRNVDYEGGFVQYMKDRMPDNISDALKKRLGKGFDALKGTFDATTADGDIIINENLPNLIDNVINTVARSAKPAEKQAIKTAATKAFADRSVAKEITKKIIPQNLVGQVGNQISNIAPWRVITRPASNISNAGTLRTMTSDGVMPDATRSILDSVLKRVAN